MLVCEEIVDAPLLVAANDNEPERIGPWLPTQKEARAFGAKTYFTGEPCRQGHHAPRYLYGGCMMCKAIDRANNRERNAAEARQWRLLNPEKANKPRDSERRQYTNALHYERNREENIARALAWGKANPEKRRATNNRWRASNKDELNARNRLAYAADPDFYRGKGREYRENNAELLRQKSREWRKNNPEKSAASTRNKKAMRKSAPGTHTATDIEDILRLQNFKCAECKVSVKLRHNRHIDHIIPLSKGGTNFRTNLQILCPPCNMHKHNTDPIDFAQRKGRLL